MFLGSFSSFSRSKRAAAKRALEAPVQQMDVRELARRTVPRDAIEYRTAVFIPGTGELDARIMDISPYGFQARASSGALERGERVGIRLPIVGEIEADVMWGLKGLFGCKFVEPIDSELYMELLGAIREEASSPYLPTLDLTAGEQGDGGVPLE